MKILVLMSSVFLFCVATARAADDQTVESATLMCQRGKLLFADDFDKPLGDAWRTAKGKWVVAGGAIQGSELKSDMHGAVTRHVMKLHDAVIQYSFKLEGARVTTFSLNDAKGHCCRVLINRAGFSVRKDDHDHEGPDQAVNLQTVKTPLQDGQWYTLVIELNGPEMLARLDGKQVGYGSHEAIDVEKTNFGLTVGGESASFKDLRVWEATVKTNWSATKAKFVKVPQ